MVSRFKGDSDTDPEIVTCGKGARLKHIPGWAEAVPLCKQHWNIYDDEVPND